MNEIKVAWVFRDSSNLTEIDGIEKSFLGWRYTTL